MRTVLFFITAISLFCSCDKIKNPIQSNANKPDVKVDTLRKILLEDYTGHTCGNCPPAALQAEKLEEDYDGRVIVIAVHAGGFAKTAKYYTTSYTTTAGNDWDGTAGFNISLGAGNPNGMVNRKNYGSGLIQGHSKWSSSVSVATKDPFILKLNVIPSYNADSRMLNTTVKATFKKPYEADTKLCVVLTEDSIIGPQKDYNPELPSDYIAKYVFMHMLRDALNGSWGQTLKTAPVMANDSINISIPSYEVSSTFQDKHLSVVAFVYDATTREVLQVEKVKMRN